MKAIFTAAVVAIIAGVAVTPAGARERLGDGAMDTVAGTVVGGSVGLAAGGYTAGPEIARRVSPRNRRIHEDRYHDGDGDGRRSASR